jgi:hypothetical protein
MLMVISGICFNSLLLFLRYRAPYREGRAVFCRCHHPRKRMIQYSAPMAFDRGFTAYWMPRFRGA